MALRILNLFSSTRGVITQKHFEKELSDVSLTTILPVLNALQKEGLLDVLVNSDRTLSWQLREQSNVEYVHTNVLTFLLPVTYGI